MRFDFLELPSGGSTLLRPVVPVQVEDLAEAPQLCLVDTGSTHNRFGAWLAAAAGLDLTGAPESDLAVGDVVTKARHARCDLTIAGLRYDAPVSFCDPWPFAFNLLGQEGCLRFFRLELCVAEGWLELTPEASA
jgi:hypothetical protein